MQLRKAYFQGLVSSLPGRHYLRPVGMGIVEHLTKTPISSVAEVISLL
jgi:hypothetical protein